MDFKKEMVSKFKSFGYKHDLYTVFNDFLTISAVSISNQFSGKDYDKREQLYLDTVKKYSKEELNTLVEVFAILNIAMENNPLDYLGDIYMELGINKKNKGQFFTPFHVAMLMAEMTINEAKAKQDIADKGYMSVNDPCCGGGIMLIAAAIVFKRLGIDTAKEVLFVAQDLDLSAVYMTYIQLSLMSVAAQVVYGNSLLVECIDFYNTPVYPLSNAHKYFKDSKDSDDVTA